MFVCLFSKYTVPCLFVFLMFLSILFLVCFSHIPCLFVFLMFISILFLVCFTQFPDALRPAFPRLKDRLDDPDTGKLTSIMMGVTV